MAAQEAVAGKVVAGFAQGLGIRTSAASGLAYTYRRCQGGRRTHRGVGRLCALGPAPWHRRGIRPGRPASSRSSSPQVPVDSVEEAEQTLAAPAELAAQKREQRLRKFRELHLKRNEARKLNHQKLWRKIKDLNYLQSGRLKKLVWNGSCRKKKRKKGVLPNIQQSSSWNPCALHRGN